MLPTVFYSMCLWQGGRNVGLWLVQCLTRAGLVPDSFWSCAGLVLVLCRTRAGLVPDSCWSRAGLVLVSCRTRVGLVPNSCWSRAELVLVSCCSRELVMCSYWSCTGLVLNSYSAGFGGRSVASHV